MLKHFLDLKTVIAIALLSSFTIFTKLNVPISDSMIVSAIAADNDQSICERQNSDLGERISACTRLISANQANTPLPDVFLNRGRAWFLRGDYSAAARDFEEVVQRAPLSYLGFQGRALARHRLGQLDEALKDLNTCIKLAGSTAALLNARGAVLNDQGEYDRAILDFNKAIGLDPAFTRAFANRAWAQYHLRRLDRALVDYNTVIKNNSGDTQALINRAAVWMDKARYDQAIEDCSTAIQIDGKFQQAYSCRGEAYRLSGDVERAILDHDRAVEIDPESAEAYNNRGLTYRDRQEFDKAIGDFGEAILRNPNFDIAYANRGEIFRLKGDLRRSISDLNKSVGLGRSSPVGLTLRGDTYREVGDADAAIGDYNQALRRVGDFVAAYVGRGLAYEAKGDTARARLDFVKALSLPSDIDAEKAKPAQSIARARIEAIAKAEAERLQSDRLNAARLAVAAAETAEQGAAQKVLLAREKEAKAASEAAVKREVDRAVAQARLEAERAANAKIAAVQAESNLRQAALKAETARVRANQALLAANAKPGSVYNPGHRVALVIGNQAYGAFGTLANPGRDADAIAASLKASGFDSVRLVKDLKREEFLSALKDFEDEAERSDWAMIYYAGHGFQINGENYLVPVDAKMKLDREVPDETVSLDRVLSTVAQARKLRIVVLDACRDNPFASQMKHTGSNRALTPGLTGIGEPTGGTLVAFAAKAGQQAMDGGGGHSPYAAALIKRLAEPNLEISMIFRYVRDDVLKLTESSQEPYTYGSLPGESFYFRKNFN
ncbi:tetratricopeptide repeat protein [Methylobacterium sp. J-068]|uniref:tetratricopeptide repeat protein n=1 Tax=Methylobacterium sp. J-068 TaxID=2836649 RepID=UPI001FB8B05A|nr:tetratricopeptide repeat protein [Methylobacterium sp. J-068]MCJ2033145.1 tetratricopeptide repeat protein [Methylobacterium sp. J-068]